MAASLVSPTWRTPWPATLPTSLSQFVFFVLDKPKEGRIARTQLLRFVESIHAKEILAFRRALLPAAAPTAAPSASPKKEEHGATPVVVVRRPAAEARRASVDHPALRRLCVAHPTLLEPLFLLQADLRGRLLGEAWWRRQEKEIQKHRRTSEQRRETTRRREESKLRRERRQEIIAEIGRMPYYLRLGPRAEAEAAHPEPLVSLNDEGEVRVEWTRTDGKTDDESGDSQ